MNTKTLDLRRSNAATPHIDRRTRRQRTRSAALRAAIKDGTK